ncbi:MAG: transcriptional regulator FtsR [Canibacter sp.]
MAATAAAASPSSSARLSIGQVLEHLHTEFSELTPSKLRFLEEQGLVTPERSASGYRKFTQAHIERLRMILTLQRDHFLPLKVISEILEEVDQGRDPIIPGSSKRQFSSILSPRRVLGREELLRTTGASSAFLGEAIAAGLIPASEVFPNDVIIQLRALLGLAERGISPRHLRQLRVAAERDTELIQQSAAARGAQPGSPVAVEEALNLAELMETVRSGVIRARIQK